MVTELREDSTNPISMQLLTSQPLISTDMPAFYTYYITHRDHWTMRKDIHLKFIVFRSNKKGWWSAQWEGQKQLFSEGSEWEEKIASTSISQKPNILHAHIPMSKCFKFWKCHLRYLNVLHFPTLQSCYSVKFSKNFTVKTSNDFNIEGRTATARSL